MTQWATFGMDWHQNGQTDRGTHGKINDSNHHVSSAVSIAKTCRVKDVFAVHCAIMITLHSNR